MHAMCAMPDPNAIPGAILRCNACGMWFKGASSEAIEQAYDQQYAKEAASSSYMGGAVTHTFLRSTLTKIHYRTGASRPVLLDIGCGTGSMLEEARALGYLSEGIELSHDLADIARKKGFMVREQNAMDLDDAEKYDVVTAMDIIEHLPRPLALLRAAHRSLKPGGELVVYTPNHRGAVVLLAKGLASMGVDFAFRNIFGGNHVCFFDDRTLADALKSTGFTIRRMWKFPYDPRRPGMKVSPINLAVIRTIEELGRPFGAVFRMVAFARKVPCTN
jgi:2-polyprenyl-3-methyl-5-hydroxy-6-metoxy-1,4-benzoquinol methylase